MDNSVLTMFFRASARPQDLLPVGAIALILFGMFFVPCCNMFENRRLAAVVAVCAMVLALGGITKAQVQFIVSNYGKAAVTLLLMLLAGVALFWKLRSKWPF